MVWDVLGTTEYTIAQLTALTFPQLLFLQRGRYRMLRSKLDVQLDARRLEGLTDEPGPKGEPSPVQKVLDDYDRRKAGEMVPLTLKDRRFQRAYRITLQKYLGDPDAPQHDPGQQLAAVEPYPGMSAEEARAIVAWVVAGDCPDEVYAAGLLPVWPNIAAAARRTS
ncbi:hypothetical protein [Deinococcus apachensis]|uniref:hypothetical protein n=1 Tax=Deinococcus apachensis TaxID=309886 RepID=UPI00037080E5|nr:hypothetical protein [Deinococcus apachensis]